MGTTDVADVGRLLLNVATSVDRGLDKSFEDSVDVALHWMDRPKKYKVTSRSGRRFAPKAVTQDIRFGDGRLAKLKYRPAAPAYWTEYGTKPHWIYPHGIARTRSIYSRADPFAGRTRRGRQGGAKALHTSGGEFFNNVFVSGVRPRPFWKVTRVKALDQAMKITHRHTVANVLKAGFGR